MTENLNNLQTRIETLHENGSHQDWHVLKREIETMCTKIEKLPPDQARALLPDLSVLIRQLDRVIEGMQEV